MLKGDCNKCIHRAADPADKVCVECGIARFNWEDVSVDDEGSMLIASMFCPNCKRWHNEVYHYGNPTEMAHYCPNCGARMDERSEDNG